jgi:hypothetical protein
VFDLCFTLRQVDDEDDVESASGVRPLIQVHCIDFCGVYSRQALSQAKADSGSTYSPFSTAAAAPASSNSRSLFAGGKKTSSRQAAASVAAEDSDSKPDLMEGWLEKKGHGKVHLGGDWQRRYASSCLTCLVSFSFSFLFILSFFLSFFLSFYVDIAESTRQHSVLTTSNPIGK